MSTGAIVLFLAPIVVGAVIGYFTNWLAIKMLFRPLREYRIFGLRVPFTPGILPRERAQIARALGNTVADDLLTVDSIAAKLRSPELKAAVRTGLEGGARRLLDMTVQDLVSGVDEGASALLREAASRAVGAIGRSEAFAAAGGAAVEAALLELESLRLAELAMGRVARAAANRLAEPSVKDAFAGAAASALVARIRTLADSGASLAAIVDRDAAVGFVRSVGGSFYPAASSAVVQVLGSPDVRAAIEKTGARLVRRTLDRFNLVQRFFIGLGQYDKTILDNMPATVSDFIDTMRALLAEDATREAIVGKLAAMTGELLGRPLRELAPFADDEALARTGDALRQAVRAALDALNPAELPAMAASAAGEASVGMVFDSFPGSRAALAEAAVAWLTGLLVEGDGPGTGGSGAGAFARVGSRFLAAFRGGSGEAKLGELIGLDGDIVSRAAAAASSALAELAARETGAMMASLDIRAMVVARINSLDMIEVERLLLRVIEKELVAITWLGGVLGALIGLSQAALQFLLR